MKLVKTILIFAVTLSLSAIAVAIAIYEAYRTADGDVFLHE